MEAEGENRGTGDKNRYRCGDHDVFLQASGAGTSFLRGGFRGHQHSAVDIPDDQLEKKPIGTGKMSFQEIKRNKKETRSVSGVELIRNEKFYGKKAYIKKATFMVIPREQVEKNLMKGKIDTVVLSNSLSNFASREFMPSKKLGLVFNVKDEQLKDKTLRAKILSQERFETPLKLTLDTIDADLQRGKAESIKQDFASRNIELQINYHNSVAMLEVLAQKKYQLLLYGFDFGRDGDPYLFWHSTQVSNMNYANWSNKDTDILLEDARMISDRVQRLAKYDEFYKLIDTEYVVKYFDVPSQQFVVNNQIKGIEAKFGAELSSRYNNFEDWYIKEKRVKKN